MTKKELRETTRWKRIYAELLKDKKSYKTIELVKNQADKLASLPISNQNNIMASYESFYNASKKQMNEFVEKERNKSKMRKEDGE